MRRKLVVNALATLNHFSCYCWYRDLPADIGGGGVAGGACRCKEKENNTGVSTVLLTSDLARVALRKGPECYRPVCPRQNS